MSLTRRTLLLGAALGPPARALAQVATPVDIDATLADHVAWVVSLFDGGAASLTPDDVEARFDTTFRAAVPPAELIATVQQLAEQFGPIELVEEEPSSAGEFVGLFRSESGEGLMISIAVDPQTGLIAGFFITPARLPTGASPVASPAASPAASPVSAGPVVEDVEAQVAQYREAVAAIRAVGEPVVDAVLAGDDAALTPLLSPQLAEALGATSIADVIASYTTRQVHMAYADAGAHFFGQWHGNAISGVMVQNGAPLPFELTAAEPQSGTLPAGTWNGTLTTIGLNFSMTFGESGESLTATLDIPAQGVEGVALSGVGYRAEQPVGDLVGERAFAPGGLNNGYTADHAWGNALLRIAVGVDSESGQMTSLTVLPAVPVPPASDSPQPVGTYRLPFDGTWWVFWGGETELQNYHVVAPSQRYACDIVIWKDGATWRGDGTDNADYWAWSQPALAPADGEVVLAVDGREDLAPNSNIGNADAAREPAGNHVVIQVAEHEYVIVAHLRQGSVRVRQGDRVTAGGVIGLVGNSGNSSEPHVHIHVQTEPQVTDPAAEGIPLRFDDILVDGEPVRDAELVQGTFVANP